MKRTSISHLKLFLVLSVLVSTIACNKDMEAINSSSGSTTSDNNPSFFYDKYYTEKPDLEYCKPGKLKEEIKLEVLNYSILRKG